MKTLLVLVAVLLTYTATQDAVCAGKQAPRKLQVAVNYVKRGGRWLEVMHMQAPWERMPLRFVALVLSWMGYRREPKSPVRPA